MLTNILQASNAIVDNAIKWIGILAACFVAIYNVPMFYSVFKHKKPESICLPMYIIMVIGCLLFAIQGLIMLCNNHVSEGLGIFLANIVGLSLAIPIMIYKIISLLKNKNKKGTIKDGH